MLAPVRVVVVLEFLEENELFFPKDAEEQDEASAHVNALEFLQFVAQVLVVVNRELVRGDYFLNLLVKLQRENLVRRASFGNNSLSSSDKSKRKVIQRHSACATPSQKQSENRAS